MPKKGVTNNPKGRSPKAIEEKYLQMFKAACTEEDWMAIIKMAVKKAKEDPPDKDARKFLADYLVGKPVENVNFSGDVVTANFSFDWSDWKNDEVTQDSTP